MKKKLWLVIPAAILQYVVIGVLCFIFFSSKSAFLGEIMQTVFGNNALVVLLLLLLFAVLSGIFVIIFSVIAMKGDYDALFVAKTAMIIKLIQIPAYIAIFVLAVLLAISLLTIPFAVALMLLDIFTLVLTGLLNMVAVFLAVRQKMTTWSHSVWVALLQLVFCADVVASVALYVRLRKSYKLTQMSTKEADLEEQCYNYIIELAKELEADFATQYETMEEFARWNLPEEIALEWIDAEGMLQTIKMFQYRSQEEIELIELIIRNFDTAFQQTQNPVWTYSAMQNDAFWHQQRSFARRLIELAKSRKPIARLSAGQETD